MFRQSVYSRVAGFEDVNDAERLSQDPALGLIGSDKVWDRGVALTSRLQTFETEMLAEEENFVGLSRIMVLEIRKKGRRTGVVCMEMAESMGVAGFDILWQGEVMLDGAKAAPLQRKMHPARGARRTVVGIY